MVNNAGIGGTEHHGMVHEMTEETWDNVMNINSRSVFLGCKYACAQFMTQEPHASGHRGWIVNTSSIMGLVGQAVYGGMSIVDRWQDLATYTNIFFSSGLLCIERRSNPFDQADCCGVREVQGSLQLHMSRT